jgi:tRNA-2-methylthio-N6-dimethylallyladenosine synthase
MTDGGVCATEGPAGRVYIWQNLMCLTYLMVLKRMEDFFVANGVEVVDAPEQADWILTGACAAFHGQIDAFFEKLEEFAAFPARTVVYGCLPRVTPHRYAPTKEKVAFYIDTRHPEGVERMVPDVRLKWHDIPAADGFRMVDYRRYDPEKRYLVVQEGCDAKCVFCPHIRGIGRAESVPFERLQGRIHQYLAQGMRTLLLEGRDLGSWGSDLQPKMNVADLLAAILDIEGDFKLFVNQLGGNWVVRHSERLLGVLRHPKLADVHIPIQTVSDRLLALMGREQGIWKLGAFLDQLGRRQAGRVLRTDMLIGFPTETEEEFEETLRFVLAHFDEVACYGFEFHPDTRLAEMTLPFLDQSVIDERVQRALAAIKQAKGVVWHRGGQVPQTMIDRERHKDQLNRA